MHAPALHGQSTGTMTEYEVTRQRPRAVIESETSYVSCCSYDHVCFADFCMAAPGPVRQFLWLQVLISPRPGSASSMMFIDMMIITSIWSCCRLLENRRTEKVRKAKAQNTQQKNRQSSKERWLGARARAPRRVFKESNTRSRRCIFLERLHAPHHKHSHAA